ncbi:MAG TPA: DUF5667 domain-containing protein [bacterium]|nr:DUF5667 domain-containing protein [bacterium]
MNKELIKNLKRISEFEAGGRPQEDWLISNRDILMSQIRPATNQRETEHQFAERNYYFQYVNDIFRQRIMKPALAVVVLFGLTLGYSATVSVANSSLEGDILYPVKTAQERVQLALTFSEEREAQLHIDFAERRLDELNRLSQQSGDSQKKVKKITKTAANLSKEVSSARDKLNQVSIASVDTALLIVKEIDSTTLDLEQKITEVKDSLPAEVKNQVGDTLTQAISTTKDTGSSALGVMVDKYTKGEAGISDQEIITRLTERIKSAEEDLIKAAWEVNQAVGAATSTLSLMDATARASSTLSLTLVSTSTIENISLLPQQAKDTLEQAKSLLVQGELASALAKVVESKEIVLGATSGAQAIVNDLQNVDIISNVKGTSTSINLQSTSTGSTSESTSPIVGQ